jgi:hypothetical protein
MGVPNSGAMLRAPMDTKQIQVTAARNLRRAKLIEKSPPAIAGIQVAKSKVQGAEKHMRNDLMEKREDRGLFGK